MLLLKFRVHSRNAQQPPTALSQILTSGRSRRLYLGVGDEFTGLKQKTKYFLAFVLFTAYPKLWMFTSSYFNGLHQTGNKLDDETKDRTVYHVGVSTH